MAVHSDAGENKPEFGIVNGNVEEKYKEKGKELELSG